jgi:ring-1,2-phenylacetyl-CoA epoxidase subunit PaaD
MVIQMHDKATKEIWELLHTIPDPEIPVISVVDLGIIRNVTVVDNEVTVEITPTYTGCPAMDMIAINIKMLLIEKGFKPIIKTVLAPAWTTDWISDEGKSKLKDYGIAPPSHSSEKDPLVKCPQCNSANTSLISQFGSTACKSLYRCLDCKECFDLFKCH